MSTPALTCALTETALGWAGVALSPAGIRHATLFHRTRQAAEAELRSVAATEPDTDRADEVEGLLRAYATGSAGALSEYPVDLPPCTPLQRRTWLALREIPGGETRSYSWLARRTGAESPRATGAMVGANPVPLWLPCHRVVAADGKLQGFGGGLAMKQALLELEGALPRSFA